MGIRVYGIPTCGTVKKARKWLAEQGIEHEWVDLREDPPPPDRIATWVATFGSKPMRNTSSGAYRALPVEKKGWGDDQWLPAFQGEVMLLKRPIVEVDGEPALVGFKLPDWEARFGS
jgi:arsenate reductase (glutaredoxin)